MESPSRKWLLLPLLLLIGAAIVPHAWLSGVCPPFHAVLKLLTGSVGATGAHFLLFLVLGTALLVVSPALRRDLLPFLLILVSVAVLQECAQLVFKARASGPDELHDLAVDLTAATLVWGAAWVLRLPPIRRCIPFLGKRG